MKKFYKIVRYLIPYWSKVALSLILNLLSVFFSLFSIFMIIPFLGVLFDTQSLVTEKPEFAFNAEVIKDTFYYYLSNIIIEKGKVSALVFVSVIVVSFSFLKNILHYFSVFFLAPVRTGVVKDMRNDIYRKIIELPLPFFSEERKGDIISRMTTDVNEIEVSIIRSLDLFFREPVLIIVYVTSLMIMSPKLTLFVLILLPVSGLLIGRIGRSLRKTSYRGQKQMGMLLSIIEETLGGLRIIKAFNAESKMNDKFINTNEKYRNLMIRLWRRRDLANPLSEFLGTS
ncbi:MAG: ABC transporter transmembrane domain-containing protein, partial [bacterium]